MFRECLLVLCGFSFGALSSAGVFTVFSTVALVPRFAGKTRSANEIVLYENMVVAGTLIGGLLSIWPDGCEQFFFCFKMLVGTDSFWQVVQIAGLIIYGLFSGMFVGSVSLAIAEMLDSIPIFTRRVSFRKGIGLAISCVALWKVCGSVFYFLEEMYR